MKEFVENSGPPFSGLILAMTAEEVEDSCPTIIWLWSGAFTSIWLTTLIEGGQGLGRFPEFSITSSCTCRLEMIFPCRSPTPNPVWALSSAVFNGVYSFCWFAPEQGERALFDA